MIEGRNCAMIKEIKKSDLKYKILQSLGELGFTETKEAVLIFEDDCYDVKIDAKNNRISGMGPIYRYYNITEGMQVELEYNDNLSEIYMKLLMDNDMEEPTDGDYSEKNASGDGMDFDFDEIESDDEFPKLTKQEALIGIPFGIRMPWNFTEGKLRMPAESTFVHACANEDLIIFQPERFPIVIIDKRDYSVRRVSYNDLKFVGKKKPERDYIDAGMTISSKKYGGNEVYFAIDNAIYKWNLNDNSVVYEMSVKKPYFISSLAMNRSDLWYTVGKPNSDKQVVGSLKSEIYKFNDYYGKIWGTEFVIENERYGEMDAILLCAGSGSQFYFFNVETGEIIRADEYCEKSVPNRLNGLNGIISGYKNKKDDSAFGYNEPYYRSNYFYTEDGYCLYVSRYNYDFIMKPDHKEPFSICATQGACVPENFLMIDATTALVKTKEYQFSIFDFKTGMRYDIKKS